MITILCAKSLTYLHRSVYYDVQFYVKMYVNVSDGASVQIRVYLKENHIS